MPELPEVEVVRRGVANWVVGRTIEHVTVNDERSLRRHVAGPQDFINRVTGLTVTDAQRRGKFLWLPVTESHETDANRALLVHLGMSGQLLVASDGQPAPRHERLRFDLSPAPSDT
ncbi:DNA-formamidopyrimidine glycosylase family protein, partial [Kocuria sp.]